jgi:hypothetical protein
MWCVVVCDLENLKNEEAVTRVGSQRHKKKLFITQSSVVFKGNVSFVKKFSAFLELEGLL